VVFALKGNMIPRDHGYLLYKEISHLAPWIDEEPLLGIHDIQGADNGHGELVLNRRAKLVIRVPKTRVDDITALTGNTIKVGAYSLEIGEHKTRSLTLHTPLYAHCVTTGAHDEKDFAADIIRLLDEMGIDSRFICGKQQQIETAEGKVAGYSLMLHGLPLEHAIRVQETGLGGNRKLGCGIFIPHKGILALV
jgi:CRISPR-associated protein Cas6